jgi:hypothetical protein
VASGGVIDVPVKYANGTPTGSFIEGIWTIDNPITCAAASYEVEYENGTPISSGTIPSGGSAIITVPNVIVCPTPLIYQRPSPTGEQYVVSNPNYIVGCDSWRVFTGADIIVQLSQGIPMTIDKAKRWKLAHTDNTFGNRFVLTGLTGGYYDPEMLTFHDADGTLSTWESAFPSEYLINHSTGQGLDIAANPTSVNFATAMTEIAAHSNAGFSDYFMPNINEWFTVVNFFYGSSLGQTGDFNPIFKTLLTNNSKWSSTTYKPSPDRAWNFNTIGDPAVATKTSTMRWVAMRNHFNNIY